MAPIAFGARTTRANNFVGVPKTAASDLNAGLGPGTYQNNAVPVTRENPAGFNSTSTRKSIGGGGSSAPAARSGGGGGGMGGLGGGGGDPPVPTASSAKTPGPGAYDYTPSINPAQAEKSGAFRSGTQRAMAARRDDTPGPGAYLRQAAPPPAVRQRGTMGGAGPPSSGDDAPVQWMRVPTAPSIPALNQAYGYEEGQHGELIMQRPVHLGYSGVNNDRCGPADYRPSLEVMKKQPRTTDFGRASGRKPQAGAPAAQAPGPGYYNTPSDLDRSGAAADDYDYAKTAASSAGGGGAAPGGRDPTSGRQKSSVFQSRVNRTSAGKTSKHERTPGPGAYDAQSAIVVEEVPAHRQFFGSTAERFASSAATERRGAAPGPGTYRADVGSFERALQRKRKEDARRRQGAAGPGAAAPGEAAFAASSLRFKAGRREHDAGPGSYEAPGMAASLQTKISSRTGVFGSSTRRFVGDDKGAAAAPGAYGAEAMSQDGHGGGGGGGAHAASAMAAPKGGRLYKPTGARRGPENKAAPFSSDTARFRESLKKTVPPPGAYYVSEKWRTDKGMKMNSGPKQRFQLSRTESSPNVGPGTYNVKTSISADTRNPKKVFVTTAQRASMGAGGGSSPGPGAYDFQLPYGNLLKPTYNIVIAEASGHLQ